MHCIYTPYLFSFICNGQTIKDLKIALNMPQQSPGQHPTNSRASALLIIMDDRPSYFAQQYSLNRDVHKPVSFENHDHLALLRLELEAKLRNSGLVLFIIEDRFEPPCTVTLA